MSVFLRILPPLFRLFLFALSGIAVLPSAAAPEKNFANRGKTLLNQKRYAEAADVLTEALKQQPDNVQILNNRGTAYLRLQRYAPALADFSRVIELSPNDAQAWCNAGVCQRKLQNCSDAVGYFDKALARRQAWPLALMERGHCHYLLKNYGLAQRDYSAAAKSAPENPDVWYSLALLQRADGNLAGAYASINRALRQDSINPEYRLLRGYVAFELDDATRKFADTIACDTAPKKKRAGAKTTKRLPSAIFSDATMAMAKAELRLDALRLRGNALIRNGDFTRAAEDFTSVLAAQPADDEAWYFRAEARLGKGDYAKAIGDASRAAILEPGNNACRVLQGIILHKQGAFTEAINRFSDALRRDSGNVQTRFNRATSYIAAGNTSAALADLAAVLAVRPTWAAAWHQQGVAQMTAAKGNAAGFPQLDEARMQAATGAVATENRNRPNPTFLFQAVVSFSNALQRNCADGESFAARARCYNLLEEYPSALQDAKRALELDKTAGKAAMELGMAQAGMKNVGGMQSAFRTASRLMQENPAARYAYGLAVFLSADSLFHAANGRIPKVDTLARNVFREAGAAFAADSSFGQARTLLGISCYFLRKYNECRELLNTPDALPVELYYRGLAHAEYGDIPAAISALRELLSVGTRREYRANATAVLETLLKQ